MEREIEAAAKEVEESMTNPDEYVMQLSRYDFNQIVAEIVEEAVVGARSLREQTAVFPTDIESFVYDTVRERLGPLLEASLKRIEREARAEHDPERTLFMLVDLILSKAFPAEPAIATQNQALSRLKEVVQQGVLPPLTSAQNAEVTAMSMAVFFTALYEAYRVTQIPQKMIEDVIEPFLRRFNATSGRIFTHVHSSILGIDDASVNASERGRGLRESFLGAWKASSFARLEISHKLAAALCVTDIHDSDDIHPPWEAWSLVIPNGLLDADSPARVWCLGKTPVVLVFPSGLLRPWSAGNAIPFDPLPSWSVENATQAEMLLALVLGSCAALSDPERVKRTGQWGRSTSESKTANRKPQRHGEPLAGTRYVLAQPVSIDLRDAVRDALSGKRGGGSPKVQFLVRGHWRHQAHGEGRKLRKWKWIEPFWKGPEDTRILLRSHKVKDEG